MSTSTVDECPGCGDKFQALGQHWRYSPDHRPSLSEEQREIITGSLMGDATLNRQSKNPRLVIGMVTKEYLEWLDEKFGVLGTGVHLKHTARESAELDIESGFRPNASHESYSDLYVWKTRNFPSLLEWNWYKTGKKVWPDDIDLTPTVLTHWYVGDGHFQVRSERNNRIQICMSNESDNTKKVSSYFESAGLPAPSSYNTYPRDNSHVGCSAQFTVEASKELFDYMNEAPPGFEYKFPD